jgi:hypothetical protein
LTSAQGIGARFGVVGIPVRHTMNNINIPAAKLSLLEKDGSPIGEWIVSGVFEQFLNAGQTVTGKDGSYEISLRNKRYYRPHWLTLLDFRHDLYAGTSKPKNFSSKLTLTNPETSEQRDVLIKMNSPLRYAGDAYFQASFDPNDDRVTVLQVVGNPSWLIPYVSCSMVGLGLLCQFGIHLVGFIRRRKKA